MSARHAALLGALALIWGASYLLIKFALEDLEAALIVFLRLALAALVLAALAPRAAAEAVREMRSRPARAALLGFMAIAAPFLLITFGELEVPSGMTAVLIAPASIFVAMFAPLLDPSERVDRTTGIGMAIGLAGVGLLVGVESLDTTGEFLGSLAILSSAVFYALAGFVVKGSYGGFNTIATSFLSISVAAAMTAPAAALSLPDRLPEAKAALAVAGLGIFGTALAFVLFYKLIAEVGAGRASLVSYIIPPVALFYGAIFYEEAVTGAAVAGLTLILAGVSLASRPRGAPAAQAQEAPVMR